MHMVSRFSESPARVLPVEGLLSEGTDEASGFTRTTVTMHDSYLPTFLWRACAQRAAVRGSVLGCVGLAIGVALAHMHANHA